MIFLLLSTILFFVHYTVLLLFGIILSLLFAGIHLTAKKGMILTVTLFVISGSLQLMMYLLVNEDIVWKLYPLITHLPIVFVLCFYCKKNIYTSLASFTAAYLFCQPAKWIGTTIALITHNYNIELIARIFTLLVIGFISVSWVAPYLSMLFNKDKKSVCIFGTLPFVYYIFDNVTGVYTNLWVSNNRIAAEFLPFFLCIIFMVFCIVYYREYEQKMDAEQKEQIVRISLEQQSKEFENIKRNKHEIVLLRHDMRLILNTLAVCIDDQNFEKAHELISSYSSLIEGTKSEQFCSNDTVNYVLSDFSSKCKADNITFQHKIELATLKVDEIAFCSILSNALDNAYNAQLDLPENLRFVELTLKDLNGKITLSVKNRLHQIPQLIDGIPTTSRDGHGYGTKSIQYMTKRLNGNYQFLVQNDIFVVRVII